jgi:hypothetical protein
MIVTLNAINTGSQFTGWPESALLEKGPAR